VAGGSVEVLGAEGNGLSVVANLQAQGNVPVLPTALEVLPTSNGHFEVLVSSAGSDTVSVFAQAAVVPNPQPGGLAVPIQGGQRQAAGQETTGGSTLAATVPAVVPGSGGAANAVPITVSAAAPVTVSTGSFSAPVGVSTGLALGGSSVSEPISVASVSSSAVLSSGSSAFTSASSSVVTLESAAFTTTTTTVLVSIRGSTYSTVAVLDFGSPLDDEPASGSEYRPRVTTSYTIGDTSPLTRFVIGLEEAVRSYRGSEEPRMPADREGAPRDLWSEDLFHRRLPSPPPMQEPQEDEPGEEGNPEARGPGADRGLLPQECMWAAVFRGPGLDDPRFLSRAAGAGQGAEFEALAVLLAGALLAQDRSRAARSREEQVEDTAAGSSQ
jgi:hypothetical protein